MTNGKINQYQNHGDNYVCNICKDTTWIFLEDGSVKRCECFEKYLNDIKIKKLKMPREFQKVRLKDFNLRPYRNDETMIELKKMVSAYIKNPDKYKGKGFYMYSSIKGSGKTYMLAILGNELTDRGYGVRFAKTTEILDAIKETFQNPEESTRDIIQGLIEVEYLLIDDIGMEKATDWVNEQFTYIIDKRMTAEKTTMFTSNVAPKGLNLNDRIINRINKMTIKAKFPEISVRDILADIEERKIVKELLNEGKTKNKEEE